ncbi:DUF1080 domain-containing protein [Mucilaginibacter sp. CSA2-8R]|uniref:3-keto-disaccharide hydrolase n=1 Tax=Mucilaginibacter sp. CSA2-8R TaxID=3141542 RepID=UPI00315CFD34
MPLVIAISAILLFGSCTVLKHQPVYQSIFNGINLNGWEGDPAYWRVENGAIIGEVTPATILKRNTFLIWRDGTPGDFEIKLQYRISARGNSGVNYRSEKIDTLLFALKGYQADLDGKDKYNLGYPRYSGQNYEERGRQFLALRGQKTLLTFGNKPKLLDSIGNTLDLVKNIRPNDWNELRIVAKGNRLQHYINGVLMSEVIDDDTKNRKMRGWLGVQVHVGPPMKVEYRNILLKAL